MMAVPDWICQFPARGEDGEFAEAGMALGRAQPRRQKRGRSAMGAQARIEGWYSGGRVKATGNDGLYPTHAAKNAA